LNSNEFRHTRSGKLELDVDGDIQLDGIQELEVAHIEAEAGALQNLFQEKKKVMDTLKALRFLHRIYSRSTRVNVILRWIMMI
jgi:hypothetical protein